MRFPRLPLLLTLATLLLAPFARANDDTDATPKLYVTIEATDQIRFHEMRQARTQRGDLVLSTLRQRAVASAELAKLEGEVVVLDEKEMAPAGASVLRLSWPNRGTVTADLTENGKNHYLGVVSRKSLLDHPDHKRLQRDLDVATRPDAFHDANVRVDTEANLYFALKAVTNLRARLTAKADSAR